jgi:serine/threonine protein kinase
MARSLHQPGDVIVDPTKQPVSDRYQIIKILGEGNSGITYAAEDITQPGVTVAIKVISFQQAQDWKVIELFEREAQVLAKLQHPGIPRYLNYFHIDTASDRRFYIVQELAQGQSLTAWVEQGWHGDEATLKQIARQILPILVYLQRLDPPVIHRDIKPQNIIRYEDGSLYLVDFGAVRDTYYSTLMRGSTVVGTYGYMAPEQFLGQAVPATDLYGLGATLLYLLTHKSPTELPQNGLSVDFRGHIQVSDAFAEWLEKLLEPDVKDRLPSAEAALLALRQPAKPVQKTQIPPLNALVALILGTLVAVWLGNSFKWRVLSSFGLRPRDICSNVNVLQNYLKQGGNPNLRIKHRRFFSWRRANQWPLLFCVSSLANAELLLKHGADPNIRESYEPILFKTALDNNLDFMKLLLKYGASPNIRVYSESNRGRSHEEAPILHYMISRNQQEFAELLIKSKGVNVNEQDSYGYTPLDLAIKFRRVKIGLMLLEKGATLNKESDPQLLGEWRQELEEKVNRKQK